MLYVLAVAGGILIGVISMSCFQATRKAHGYFKVVPLPEEEGFYTVNVRLVPDQRLLKKEYLVLERDVSQL